MRVLKNHQQGYILTIVLFVHLKEMHGVKIIKK